MRGNLRAGTYPPHKISTEMKWVDTKGCAHLFAITVSYRETLCERLAASYSLTEANLACRLACMIIAMEAKRNGIPFALCRRGLSGQDREDGKPRHLTDVVKALGFTEWHARIAIRMLRAVGFIQLWSQQMIDAAKSSWASWRRVLPFAPKKGKDWNKSMLRRTANLYTIGDEFVRAAMAERRRRVQGDGRKAWLKHQIQSRTEAEARESKMMLIELESECDDSDSGPRNLGSFINSLPDTQLQESSREELKIRESSPLDEGSTTLGESSSGFAGMNILAMAMAAASKTKPGDDLSEFVPSAGPRHERPVMLRPIVGKVHPWSPLEAAIRDLEDGVFGGDD